jgi:PAS domain S-box-containing protein
MRKTDKHHVEELQKIYETALDTISDPLFVKDSEGRWRYANEPMSRILRIPLTQLIGRTDQEIFPETIAQMFRERDDEALRAGRWVEHEELILTADCETLTCLTKRTPYTDSAGKRGVIGVVRDVTERETLISNLKASKERLELALNAGRYGTWDWDIVSDVQVWDDVQLTLFGLTRENFSGKTECFAALLAPGEMERLEREMTTAIATRTNFSTEFRVRVKDQIRILRTECTIFYSAQGAPQRLVGMNWDVTAEREREQMFAQQSKLSAVGEMAAGIAHEINNPLAVVSVKAQQLKEAADAAQKAEKPEGVEPALVSKLAEGIERTASRIAKIVRGLRTLSRNAEHDPFEAASVSSLVDDALSICRSRFAHHGVPLEVLDNCQSLAIECRPTQVSQILVNLVNNAFDAVAAYPEKWVRIESALEGDTLVFRVIDSGKGIPAELRERVLQAFFTTKAAGKGTGLGLSIVMGLVKAHEGSLVIEHDHPNTCFAVRLPRLQKHRIEDAAA